VGHKTEPFRGEAELGCQITRPKGKKRGDFKKKTNHLYSQTGDVEKGQGDEGGKLNNQGSAVKGAQGFGACFDNQLIRKNLWGGGGD